SRRSHTRFSRDWSSDVCSSDLVQQGGLRGVLDSIVNDGMRVAAEVRRRMEEEVEKAAAAGNAQEDDEDEEGGVEDRDRDLLKGADRKSVVQGKREGRGQGRERG